MSISRKTQNQLQIVVVAVIAVISFALFLKLADEAVWDSSLSAFDLNIAQSVYSLRTPTLTNLMLAVTSLGSTVGVAVLATVIIVIMYLYKRKYILPLLEAMAGATVFSYVFKQVFARLRPETVNALVQETNFSFPSGHMLIGICFYGAVAYLLIRVVKPKWAKLAIAVGAVVLVTGIGFSRVYLGVHWPTDVVASTLLGISWLCLIDLTYGILGNAKTNRKS